MIRVLRRIVIGIVFTRVRLIRGRVMLRVARSTCTRGCVVDLVVLQAAIGIHDHASGFVRVRRRGIRYVVMVVRIVTLRHGVEAQRAGQMVVHRVCAATGAG